MGFYYDDNFASIINKEIISIEWNELELKFILKDKIVKYLAVGDCCSQSFIEDLDNPEVFKNCVLTNVDFESGEEKDFGDYSVHKWTFYKFRTNKGMCTLSFRNESNGYYDGWLQLTED